MEPTEEEDNHKAAPFDGHATMNDDSFQDDMDSTAQKEHAAKNVGNNNRDDETPRLFGRSMTTARPGVDMSMLCLEPTPRPPSRDKSSGELGKATVSNRKSAPALDQNFIEVSETLVTSIEKSLLDEKMALAKGSDPKKPSSSSIPNTSSPQASRRASSGISGLTSDYSLASASTKGARKLCGRERRQATGEALEATHSSEHSAISLSMASSMTSTAASRSHKPRRKRRSIENMERKDEQMDGRLREAGASVERGTLMAEKKAVGVRRPLSTDVSPSPGAVRITSAKDGSSSSMKTFSAEFDKDSQPSVTTRSFLARDSSGVDISGGGLLSTELNRRTVVNAFVVEPEDDEEKVLAEASPLQEENKTPRRLLMGFLATALLVLIVVLSITLTRSEAGMLPTPAPSVSPSESPSFSATSLEVLLEENSIVDPAIRGTPQYDASQWLLDHADGDLLSSYTTDRILQRYALAVLYLSLGGISWLNKENWLDPSIDECNWFLESEDSCDESRTMTHLLLEQNFLRGRQLPPEIALLTGLKVIDMSANDISGTLPTELGLMTNLEYLVLDSNSFRGTIPPELASAASLKVLALDSNHLTCPQLCELDEIDSTCNQPASMFPTEFGQLQHLKVLSLGDNPLGELDEFRTDCTIPSEIGWLSASLQKLDISRTHPVGSIPSEVGVLGHLVKFHLPQSRSLKGALPTELGLLTMLISLDIEHVFDSSSDFRVTIPTELGLMSSLTVLKFDDHHFAGSIPTELGELSDSLEMLYIHGHITGTIPEELGLLTRLFDLHLHDSNLTGTIPTQLGLLTNIHVLSLSGEQRFYLDDPYSANIAGPIPSEIGRLTLLTSLQLDDLPLSGTIPSELLNLTQLTSLHLARTNVSGSIEGLVCDDQGNHLIRDSSAMVEQVECTCCTHQCVVVRESGRLVYSCRAEVVHDS